MPYSRLSLFIIAMHFIFFGLINAINNSNNNEWDIQNYTKHIETKIVGGYHDPNSKWAKYTASLRSRQHDKRIFGSGHFCGGSIISAYTILSAAHCVYNRTISRINNVKNYHIVVGSIYRIWIQKSTQILQISKFIVHPEYEPIFHFNDVCLIILKREIRIDGKHTGITRLPSEPIKPNIVCTVAGWGQQYYNGPHPNEILYVHLIVLSEEECKSRTSGKSPKDFCARDIDDLEKDTCQGDSGGPLYASGITTYAEVIGIVSRGPPCGDLLPTRSGLYTHVYYYVDWIKRNSVRYSNSCCKTKFYFRTALYIYIYVYTSRF